MIAARLRQGYGAQARLGRGAATILLLGAFLLAYLPDLGHGFISDDFRWIHSAERALQNPQYFLTETTGFFRPLVTLSFAIDSLLFGHDAFAYGVTNLFLALGCAVLLYAVCRAECLSPAASLVAAGAWSFNFHGINMAILWTSGRTSLLLTLFALLAARATLGAKPWQGALWCLAALLSKEEAIALPLILAIWSCLPAVALPAFAKTMSGKAKAGALVLPLAVYFVARTASDAFWPADAPDYYRFTFDLGSVVTNAAHYLDRAATTSAVIASVAMLASWKRFCWEPRAKRPVLHGLVWLVGGYAITVWLPVRSSLYAVFPSVGAVLILAAFFGAFWNALDSRVRTRVVIVLVALPFLLSPVYRARNVRWVELADLTRSALEEIAPHVPALKGGGTLVVHDAAASRANVSSAFGNHLPDAVELRYGVRPDVVIVNDLTPTAPSADPRRPTFSVRSPASP